MATRRLDRAAFDRPTLTVARDLLGKFIVHRHRGRELRAMIAEVEAYKGPKDLASHAARGRRTPRVEPLYADGGTVYVYFVYGMHWLMNFSTCAAGKPEAVLIRGVVAVDGKEEMLVEGPARVTRHLRVDKRLDGEDATTSSRLWVEDHGVHVPARAIRRGPRVGIDYAGPYWSARPWRFWIDGHAKATPRGTRGRARRGGR